MIQEQLNPEEFREVLCLRLREVREADPELQELLTHRARAMVRAGVPWPVVLACTRAHCPLATELLEPDTPTAEPDPAPPPAQSSGSGSRTTAGSGVLPPVAESVAWTTHPNGSSPTSAHPGPSGQPLPGFQPALALGRTAPNAPEMALQKEVATAEAAPGDEALAAAHRSAGDDTARESAAAADAPAEDVVSDEPADDASVDDASVDDASVDDASADDAANGNARDGDAAGDEADFDEPVYGEADFDEPVYGEADGETVDDRASEHPAGDYAVDIVDLPYGRLDSRDISSGPPPPPLRREVGRYERERLSASTRQAIRMARHAKRWHEIRKMRNVLLSIDQGYLKRMLGEESEALNQEINALLRSWAPLVRENGHRPTRRRR